MSLDTYLQYDATELSKRIGPKTMMRFRDQS